MGNGVFPFKKGRPKILSAAKTLGLIGWKKNRMKILR
jgi:hypothetical protein